jgi:hypothetical protein
MKNSLINSYLEAKYVVLDNDFTNEFTIKVNLESESVNLLLDKYQTKHAVFITPENPFSEKLTESENLVKHKEFLQVLNSYNLNYLSGYGTDELEEWGRESSYLIFVDSMPLANDISLSFKQNAYIAIEKNKKAELLILENKTYTKVIRNNNRG